MASEDRIEDIILVTGATRRVGAEVVSQLAAQGVYVRAAVRDIEAARAQAWRGVEIAPFRYDQRMTYAGVFADVNRLLLVLPPGDFESHDGEIADLVDFAKQSGVDHVVFVSSQGTENLHISTQWGIERHLIKSGMAYTILRSGWFFQNLIDNPMLRADIQNGVYRSPFAHAKVSSVDVRDVAAVAVAAFTQPGHRNRIYSLGEYVMDSYEVAAMLAKVLGRDIRVESISEHEAAHALRAAGMDRQVAKWWRIVYQLMQQGAYHATVPDVSRVLGRPSITFKQFVQKHASEWLPD